MGPQGAGFPANGILSLNDLTTIGLGVNLTSSDQVDINSSGSYAFDKSQLHIKENTGNTSFSPTASIAVDMWNFGGSNPSILSSYIMSNSYRNSGGDYRTSAGTSTNRFSSWLIGALSWNSGSNTTTNTSDAISIFYGKPGVANSSLILGSTLNEVMKIHSNGALTITDALTIRHETNTDETRYIDKAVLKAKRLTMVNPTNGLSEEFVYLVAKDKSGNSTVISSHLDPSQLVTPPPAAPAPSVSSPSGLSGFRTASALQTTGSTTATPAPAPVPPIETSFTDPAVLLPWSFTHQNNYIGKQQIVDMAKAIHWIEAQMKTELGDSEGKIIYTLDLPAAERWTETTLAEAIIDQKIEQLTLNPEYIEVPLVNNQLPAEAWEEVPVLTWSTEEITETVHEIDWNTQQIVPVTKTTQRPVQIPTGDTQRQLKANYKLHDGKLYRLKTVEDIEVTPSDIPNLPEWVQDRMPAPQLTGQLGSRLEEVLHQRQLAHREQLPLPAGTTPNQLALKP
ncbi:MAG: hypothetical protein SFY68_12760 [Candidatus Sumerlaeia bacterium]|nr:hypothetical protein [Candidatus Sumerlaeia bacterium]